MGGTSGSTLCDAISSKADLRACIKGLTIQQPTAQECLEKLGRFSMSLLLDQGVQSFSQQAQFHRIAALCRHHKIVAVLIGVELREWHDQLAMTELVMK